MSQSTPTEKQYFLGIDIGGSKSHALIATASGQALGFGHTGSGNHEVVGWDGLKTVLDNIIGQALASAGISLEQITAAGFGLAGYDWPEDREPHIQVINSVGLQNTPFELVNDAMIGLLAKASEGWGVVVSAGTSNNCCGRDQQGREGRITGQGPYFAEHGGAGEVVFKALQAMSLAWSKRGPATALSDAFLQETGASDMMDLFGGITRGRYKLSAHHAPLIFQVAAAGDQVAQEIIVWAGQELGNLANGVIRQLGLEEQHFEVILSGSFYNGGQGLIKAMQSTIYEVAPLAQLRRLAAPPVIGGVVLALEQVNLDPTAIRQPLIDSTLELLKNSW